MVILINTHHYRNKAKSTLTFWYGTKVFCSRLAKLEWLLNYSSILNQTLYVSLYKTTDFLSTVLVSTLMIIATKQSPPYLFDIAQMCFATNCLNVIDRQTSRILKYVIFFYFLKQLIYYRTTECLKKLDAMDMIDKQNRNVTLTLFLLVTDLTNKRVCKPSGK